MTDVTESISVTGSSVTPSQTVSVPGYTVPSQSVSVAIPAQTVNVTVPSFNIPTQSVSVPGGTYPVTGSGTIDITTLAQAVAAILAASTPVASQAPTITSFTPTSGAVGSTVTITGNNLSNITSATIAGMAATIASNSSTSVTLVAPAATANDTGYITLTSSAGTATSGAQFEIVVPVVVTPPTTTGTIGAPVNFTMTNQTASSFSFTWTAVAGAAKYNIYRNGALIGSSTTTSYTDNSATNATVPTFAAPATIYKYAITSVDTSGNEGPQNTNLTYWAYHLGKFYWAGDYSVTTQNYADTAGLPVSNTADISVSYSGTNGYFQPYSGAPSSPEWACEIGSFNTMLIDVKPAAKQTGLQLNIISRLPQGDVYNNAAVRLDSGKYGKWTPGTWCHFVVPFSDLGIGTGTLVGSASGTTLTVTSATGLYAQATDWISAPGITSAPVAISAAASASNGAGTYTLNSPGVTAPAGTVFNTQRTNMYKFSLVDQSNVAGLTYYLDNIGFTQQ